MSKSEEKYNKRRLRSSYITTILSISLMLFMLGLLGLVIIHDGARPLVSLQTISRTFEMAEIKGNAVPVVSVNESLRVVNEKGNQSVDREAIKIIQTPQCFYSEQIKKAYDQEYKESFTDDATVLEAMGEKINLVEGNIENIKITNPIDLLFAENLITTL